MLNTYGVRKERKSIDAKMLCDDMLIMRWNFYGKRFAIAVLGSKRRMLTKDTGKKTLKGTKSCI